MTVISKSEFRRSTWKNGLGYTDQIAIFPAQASLQRGDFLWRLSSAKIDQGSAFSLFPDHDRTLIILTGTGVRLTHQLGDDPADTETIELSRYQAYDFPGEVPSRCELLDGPVTDLSLFLRKGECEGLADLTSLTVGNSVNWEPTGRWNFLICPDAAVTLCQTESDKRLELPAGDALLIEGGSSVSISGREKAHLVQVSIS